MSSGSSRPRGAEIHQTIVSSGAGYAAHTYRDTEIQKRSYPNSFGGQFQNRGYDSSRSWSC